MFVHYKLKRLAVIITVFCVVTMIYRYVYNNIININGNRLHSSRLFLGGDANISSSSAITTDKKIRKWIWYSNFNFTSKALPDVSADSAFDAMSIKPIHFDERFKNPCWKGQDNFELLNEENVYCLPYFYLIGVKKSGTTDLFNKISRHPDFCKPSFSKECQWISSMRFNAPNYVPKMKKIEKDIKRKGIDVKNIEFYVSMFDSAASCITRNKSSTVFNKVTADSSVATLYSHTSWEQLKVNMNLDEPRYTNFHLIKQLTPQAKLIIIFRDPTKRLYSDFLHNTRGRYKNMSPEIFHKQVQVVIAAYQNCFKSFTQRSCIYNNTMRQDLLAVSFTYS
ncbi:carbohydrate sulfotransferase 15-like [Ruditapes philippinarum]|uniref:carbohydrate sulfotransferase 15-like n=1 Tax=Ruditapes philippinarum TaxID=129788 RepID=UPI00295B3BE5|nr:carbohydrate sulfotransferase 15-like [Ruditapes philippinarum]